MTFWVNSLNLFFSGSGEIRHLDIEPKNVILIGDSAGGNLVCALTIKLIKAKGRIPDGLVLACPGFLFNFMII